MAPSKRQAIVLLVALLACAAGGVFAWRARRRMLETEAIHRNNLALALLEGNWRSERGLADAAVVELEAALRCKPDYRLARINLGMAQYYRGLQDRRSGGFEKAAEVLETLLGSEPNNPFVRFTLGCVRLHREEHKEALEQFEAVRALDPLDMPSLFFLADCLKELGRGDEAILAFQKLIETCPRHRRAYYRLREVYGSVNKLQEMRAATNKFAELSQKENTDFLFQGVGPRRVPPPEKYATPIPDSRSLKPRSDPPPRYVDVTRERGVTFQHSGPAPDGEVERAVAGEPMPHDWFANPESQRALAARVSTSCAFGDWNGDSRLDLLLADPAGKHALFEQDAGGKFADVTVKAGLKTDLETVTACAFGDLDDDGFLDLVLAGPGGARVLRNTGGALSDVTAPWGFRDAVSPLDALTVVAIADHDHDGDLDVFAGGGVITADLAGSEVYLRFPSDFAAQPSRLFRNNGNGTFTEVGADAGVADALERGRFVRSAFFADVDDDVAVDLVTVDWRGEPRVFLSRKDGTFSRAQLTAGDKLDTAVRAVLPELLPIGESRSFGDFDGDGGVDRLTVRCGRPAVLERCVSVPERWLTVRLRTPRKKPDVGQSNGFGIGSRVEARWVGSWQKRELRLGNGQGGCDAPELTFDLGREDRIDFARARFPSAARKSEKDLGSNQVITIMEPDMEGISCPAVFAWNGERFELIADTISAGVFGELTGPGTYWHPDPDEWLRIDGAQLRERDGALELRFANALEEVTYLDGSRLVAVDHAEDLEVSPDERMALDPSTRAPARFLVLRALRPIARAADHRGRDVTPSLETIDRDVFDGFAMLPFKGFAEDWSLTLDLGAAGHGSASLGAAPGHASTGGAPGGVLLLHGWMLWNSVASAFGAAQAGLTLHGPVLDVLGLDGQWRQAIDDLGIPAGLPRTMVVRLGGILRPGEHVVRIRTNRTVFFDRAQTAQIAEEIDPGALDRAKLARAVELPLEQAALRWLGYPRRGSADGKLPVLYDYSQIDPDADWRTHPGLLTRHGDVKPLLRAAEGAFVVMGHGDEIALRFDARSLPAGASGTKRTYLLFSHGYEKGFDFRVPITQAVEPHPGGPESNIEAQLELGYPFDWNTRPSFARQGAQR